MNRDPETWWDEVAERISFTYEVKFDIDHINDPDVRNALS